MHLDSASPRTLNLSQVVARDFHFSIVSKLPASILIHFRKFSALQLSETTIVKRANYKTSSFKLDILFFYFFNP